jgi:hypothetical protein
MQLCVGVCGVHLWAACWRLKQQVVAWLLETSPGFSTDLGGMQKSGAQLSKAQPDPSSRRRCAEHAVCIQGRRRRASCTGLGVQTGRGDPRVPCFSALGKASKCRV